MPHVVTPRHCCRSGALGDLHALAWALQIFGVHAMCCSELDEAIRLAEEGLAVQRELNDPLKLAGACRPSRPGTCSPYGPSRLCCALIRPSPS